jgi:hypothetical protein
MRKSDPVRQFADRVFRKALSNPINLRSFLNRAIPEIAKDFDFDRVQVLDRSFLLEDWRERESDVLVELPYRTPTGATQEVLVCVLLEHQSQTDWRLVFRTLFYAMLYWERQLRTWEAEERDERAEYGAFRFTPVVPIVLYAASTPWGSARTFAELVGGPESLRGFAPRWAPFFWELSQRTAQELLNSQDAFDQLLAVVRAEEATADEFEPILRAAFEHIQQTQHNRVYLSDMLEMVFSWARWRRPDPEQPRWEYVADDIVKDKEERERMRTMSQSAISRVYNEGVKEGHDKGFVEGEVVGEVNALRRSLLRTGHKRYGEPNDQQLKAINECVVIDRLEGWLDKVSEAANWDELLQK